MKTNFKVGDSVRIKRKAKSHMVESGFDFDKATVTDIMKLYSDGYFCTVETDNGMLVTVHESTLRLA